MPCAVLLCHCVFLLAVIPVPSVPLSDLSVISTILELEYSPVPPFLGLAIILECILASFSHSWLDLHFPSSLSLCWVIVVP